MTNQIFDGSDLRKDKVSTCARICIYLKEEGRASKTQIAKALERPYSRISENVDWLAKVWALEIESVDDKSGRPGKPEIFYRLKDDNVVEMLVEKYAIPNLAKVIREVLIDLSRLRESYHVIGPIYLPGYSRKEQERYSASSALSETINAISYVFSDTKSLYEEYDKIDPKVAEMIFFETLHNLSSVDRKQFLRTIRTMISIWENL